MKQAVLALLGFAVIAVSGCASVSIAPEQVSAIRSTSVSPQVKMAASPAYYGPEDGLASSGLIGAAIASAIIVLDNKKPPLQIKAYLAAENIDVGEIVRTQFEKGLASDPRFSSKVREHGETTFELEVQVYGLVSNGPFSSEFKPWLSVRATLVDASGNMMWQATDFAYSWTETVPPKPYSTYFEDPEHFRSAFTAAGEAVTRGLLGKL